MTVQAHAAAFLDLLRADDRLTVLDGEVPDEVRPPYVLVYITVDDSDGQSPDWGDGLDGDSGVVTARAYCHSVGGSADAARIVAGYVREDLLDREPPVEGRTQGKIRKDFSSPPVKDESTGVVVMDQIDVYRLRTNPA
ncbi:hypothetical protein EYA84_02025 [Verrucosispora sp. SN26_14.1]|uniref:hypothetical protein n=1 Tax=Verrucosispora sp. SN26_14.1 TaxID=2527879 RepID=UPI0010352CDF|nr:hypothetical protein [Verrucosispora sp. SN26_14.1]TBL44243.1 hypothetical protein EYA84_02025 [Verrucosispora sp. SN26_14.1]